jgi:hypothetical protein
MVTHDAIHVRSPTCPEATPAPFHQPNHPRHHRQFAGRNPIRNHTAQTPPIDVYVDRETRENKGGPATSWLAPTNSWAQRQDATPSAPDSPLACPAPFGTTPPIGRV